MRSADTERRRSGIVATALILLVSAPSFGEDARGLRRVAADLVDSRAQANGEFIAVFIAIDDYDHWPALSNPVKDARQIREILEDRYVVDRFIELYDADATRANIAKLFTDLQQADPDDSIFVYYAGHGHMDEASDTAHWIPVDAGVDRFEQDRWFQVSQIRGYVRGIKARHFVIFADSCFSGDLLDQTRSGLIDTSAEAYYRNAYQRVSRQIVTSGASETVPDESEFAL